MLPGTPAPSASVHTADGDRLDLASLRGRTALLFYEDKDSTRVNQALKDAITTWERTLRGPRSSVVHAIADVSAYDYWPARNFVKDAIRKEERRSGVRIYLDWSGEFRRAFGLARQRSNLVLIDAEQRVLLTHTGVVPPELRDRILEALAS